MSVFLIARRDLAAYLQSASGWVIIAVMLVLNGLFFNAFALGGNAKYSHEVLGGNTGFFFWTSGITCAVAILLSMRRA